MNSKEQTLTLRKKYIGPSLSLAYDDPLKIIKGNGQYLYDENGREYLDCVNTIYKSVDVIPDSIVFFRNLEI